MTNSFLSTGRAPVATLGSLAFALIDALDLMLTPSLRGPTITFGTRRLSDWPAEVKRLGPTSMGQERRSNGGAIGTSRHAQGSLTTIAALLPKTRGAADRDERRTAGRL